MFCLKCKTVPALSTSGEESTQGILHILNHYIGLNTNLIIFHCTARIREEVSGDSWRSIYSPSWFTRRAIHWNSSRHVLTIHQLHHFLVMTSHDLIYAFVDWICWSINLSILFVGFEKRSIYLWMVVTLIWLFVN